MMTSTMTIDTALGWDSLHPATICQRVCQVNSKKHTVLAAKVINVSTYVSYEYVTHFHILRIENTDKVSEN